VAVHSTLYDLPSEHESHPLWQTTSPGMTGAPGVTPPPEAPRQLTPGPLVALTLASPPELPATGGGEVSVEETFSVHAFIASDSALHGVWPVSHDADDRQSSSASIAASHPEEASAFFTESAQSLSHCAGVSSLGVAVPQSQGGQLQVGDPVGHAHEQLHDCLPPRPHASTVSHAALQPETPFARSCSAGVPDCDAAGCASPAGEPDDGSSFTVPPHAVAASAAKITLRIHRTDMETSSRAERSLSPIVLACKIWRAARRLRRISRWGVYFIELSLEYRYLICTGKQYCRLSITLMT
jgi:hypothetical protein